LILARVIETGVGVPDEAKDKIFSPLFTTKAKGTGLGLSVCKRNVETHAGETSFKSEFGVGPTFTLKIPTQKEECGLEENQPHDILSGVRSTEQVLN
jgi:signal transduction histidine kinase